jgi:hypothetical protein
MEVKCDVCQREKIVDERVLARAMVGFECDGCGAAYFVTKSGCRRAPQRKSSAGSFHAASDPEALRDLREIAERSTEARASMTPTAFESLDPPPSVRNAIRNTEPPGFVARAPMLSARQGVVIGFLVLVGTVGVAHVATSAVRPIHAASGSEGAPVREAVAARVAPAPASAASEAPRVATPVPEAAPAPAPSSSARKRAPAASDASSKSRASTGLGSDGVASGAKSRAEASSAKPDQASKKLEEPPASAKSDAAAPPKPLLDAIRESVQRDADKKATGSP